MTLQQQLQQQIFCLKILRVLIFNRLVNIGYMYYFALFFFIRNYTLLLP